MLAAWVLLLLAVGGGAMAQDLKPLPQPPALLTDQTATLTPTQFHALQARLTELERELGSQIAVLIVASTAPEDIADYTQRLGDAWKIGRRDVGDGVLIVVAKEDRKVRIAPAKSLEGAVPDLAARQIIQGTLAPAFRQGDYADGLNAAIDQLAARIRGEALPAPGRGAGGRPATFGADIGDLALLFFIAVPIVGALLTAVMGRKLGSLLTAGGTGALAFIASTSLLIALGAGLVALILVGVLGIGASRRGSGMGGPGGLPPVIFPGGGGAGGGGGWSSGGGGDFGGGGASGSW
ncbi:MAG: hypothetical protein RLZZ598_1963 [Pseudomonadota bacterium]|jgi:uncharacterized protein